MFARSTFALFLACAVAALATIPPVLSTGGSSIAVGEAASTRTTSTTVTTNSNRIGDPASHRIMTTKNKNKNDNNDNDKPTVPTRCTSSNQGSCDCGKDSSNSNDVITYVWWISENIQRCIHTFNLDSNSPNNNDNDNDTKSKKPVLISVSGYGQGMIHGQTLERATHYDYAAIGIGSTTKDGAGGFGLEFPNNGVVNTENPTPCDAGDSRDYAYISDLLDFIASYSSLDPTKVYAEGFSQSSMFAAYIGICFADRMTGIFQGGSGLAKTGYTPVVPGKQGQCTFRDQRELEGQCCRTRFCEECTWWPVYPRTVSIICCRRPSVLLCIAQLVVCTCCCRCCYHRLIPYIFILITLDSLLPCILVSTSRRSDLNSKSYPVDSLDSTSQSQQSQSQSQQSQHQCENKIIDCLATYTNDNIACGSDLYMYEAMVAENNDARLLSFSPAESSGIPGGHQNPNFPFDWMVGCLGIVEACSDPCQNLFLNCVQTSGGGDNAFESCKEELESGSWEATCTQGCALTLEMLQESQLPVVTLSEGKFGTQSDYPAAGSKPAPAPNCSNDFGTFQEVNYNGCGSTAEPPTMGPIETCGPPTVPTTSAPVATPTPVEPITPAPMSSSNPMCGPDCENEFPTCVQFHGNDGADGCAVCRQELHDAGSTLVNRGNCVVGCTLTDAMFAVCDEGDTPPVTPVVPTGMPTPGSSSGCTQQNASDKFYYKTNKKKGKEVTKKCSWLEKQKEKKKLKICSKFIEHVATTTGEEEEEDKVTAPAQDVCQQSCNSCAVCYENTRSRFFTGKYKDGTTPVSMKCKALQKKSENKKETLCAMTEVNIYGPAKEVCPQTCESGGC